MQNWRFIAVRTPEAKARLRPIAWDQPAITEAAVTFIGGSRLARSEFAADSPLEGDGFEAVGHARLAHPTIRADDRPYPRR